MNTDADRTDHTGSTDGTEQLRLPAPPAAAAPGSTAQGSTVPDSTVPDGATPQSEMPTYTATYGAAADSAAAGGTFPSETASAGTSPAAPERPQPRTGPIVWGCLLLAFCAYLVQRVFAPGTVDTAFWITGTVFGLGALLLGVGIAILARNARRRR